MHSAANESRRSISREAFVSVRAALDLGKIVHAYHPDFGGTVTAGTIRCAVGPTTLGMIHHGGNFDVSEEGFNSTSALARAFVYQVGKISALQGARRALED